MIFSDSDSVKQVDLAANIIPLRSVREDVSFVFTPDIAVRADSMESNPYSQHP